MAKRAPLYSRSTRPAPVGANLGANVSANATEARGAPASAAADAAGVAPAPFAAATHATRRRWRQALMIFAAVLALAFSAQQVQKRMPRSLTQADVDAAVKHALQTIPLPAPAAKAYEAVRGSVVRVVGEMERVPEGGGSEHKTFDEEDDKRSVGSGVVIIDKGVILTNLHVVSGAKRITVTFADGLEAEAHLLNTMPEHDLAVLQARKLPDDLQAATMRSTGDLKPGDRVTAIGFPFGIGPSVSHGVVSGLKREFRSPEGKRILTNLIQFDAAANPGSSGGPLVTDDGEVVGIVTAILNPTQQRFFVGIGFAVPIENAAAGAGLPPF